MAEKTLKKLSARAAYGRMWREWLVPHWAVLLVALLLMLIVAILAAGYAKFMELVIDGLSQGSTYIAIWGPIGIILLTSVKGFSQYFYQVLQNNVLVRVQADMQKKMYESLLYMDLSNLLAEAPAALATRFSADIELVRTSAKEVFGSITAVLTIIATLVVMLSIDWAMTIGLIGIFTLAFGPVGIIGARVRKISGKTQAEIAEMTGAVNEGLSGIRMVRTYRLEERVKSVAEGIFERLYKLRKSLLRWQVMITPMIEVLGGLAVGALLFLVAYRMQTGAIDLGGFIGLLTALGVITNPARRLGRSYAVALQGTAALERIYALFDTPIIIADGDLTFEDGQKAKGRIEFRDVSFTYPDGFKALHEVNLTIEPGKTYAFVGRSGAGKSTIFNLMPRLFEVSKGAILLDGSDVRDFTLAALRDQISVVSQDSILLSGTVIENIGFGREGANEAECIKAAKDAAAHGFIRKLEDGYQTVIDPSKNSFSGGEKQRLSIARAIVRDAPILLLDEPTSALDAESEASIRAALDTLSENRTTLVIAHRLSTILDADQIVVMDQGRIVDQGTHGELLERGGIYAELYNLQFDMPSSTKAKHDKPFTQEKGRSWSGPLGAIGRYLGL